MSTILQDLDIKDFKVLLSPPAGAGVTTSDDTIRREIIKSLIYKKADFISVGTKIVGLETFDNLDIRYTFPSEAAVEYPVPEGAGADLTRVEWSDFGFQLKKAEGRFMITDEAMIRGVDRVQWQTSIRRLGESMAATKDANILGTLAAGCSNTVAAAGATWATATAANITTDVSATVNNLISAQGIVDSDIGKIVFVVPVASWAGLLRIQIIGTMQISMFDFLTKSYGITILPSKYFTTTGMALIKGAETAIHGTLRPPANIPLVEAFRHEGVGTEYVVRQFFATTVIPESETVATSDRVVCLTGI